MPHPKPATPNSLVWRSTIIWLLLLVACAPPAAAPTSTIIPTLLPSATPTAIPTPTEAATPAPMRLVPDFAHIAVIVLENKEYGTVMGSRSFPYFNLLAASNTLLTQHYAIAHPSLPNYLALIGGDTFGVVENCETCFVDAESLPDLIEASGRSWKTYQEDMPEPCFLGNTVVYVQKHNPFVYFDPIRLNGERCVRSVVPFSQLDADMTGGSLPNFMFITPNLCYSAHSCALEMADAWLDTLLDRLVPAFQASGGPYLIIVTWDEGQNSLGCCGLSEPAGGRIATILISPQARQNFEDDTPYTHYSLLRTISEAWGLPLLGHAADASTALITRPWR